MEVESGGNDNAHGDIGYHNPRTGALEEAFGPMQIRQPYVDDVNKVYGTNFQPAALLGRRSQSLAVFWLYMSIYATSAQLGRPVTDEDRARIHNGGPAGWKNPATLEYWNKVQAAMNTA